MGPGEETDEEASSARLRGLMSGDRSQGNGGGGYSRLLAPSGVENAKTDAARFRGAVGALTETSRCWRVSQ